jgi:hypothetical protein
MKKHIQAIAIALQFLAVVFYIGIFKTAIAWKNGDTNGNTFFIVILMAGIIQMLSMWLKNKYPKETNNAEDIVFTKKELKEREKGNNKNPLFIKILLIIPITFAILVVLSGIFVLIQTLTGN